MSKKNILIVGYLESFGVGAQLLHSLDWIRKNVYFLRLISDWSNIMKLMDQESTVIAVSFAPHYKYTYECVEMAKSKGASVITISDSPLNPLSKLSDYELNFALERNAELNMADTSPVINFVHYMICYLYENYKDQIDEYIISERRYEEYME